MHKYTFTNKNPMIFAVTKRAQLGKELHIIFILWNCYFSSRTNYFAGLIRLIITVWLITKLTVETLKNTASL